MAQGCLVADGTSGGDKGIRTLEARAEKVQQRYATFRSSPGQLCANCWLVKRFCCCAGVAEVVVKLRPRVLVVMHPAELDQRRGSNTAKLLLQLGAELVVWGAKGDMLRLEDSLIAPKGEGSERAVRSDAMIFFPAPEARDALEFAPSELERNESTSPKGMDQVGCIVVLDGNWKEARKMNKLIDPRVQRCRVTTISRSDCGGTRKYDPQSDTGRVQTAGAFMALMRDLGEDPACVEGIRAALVCFMSAFEKQLRWSGVPPSVAPLMVHGSTSGWIARSPHQ